jgi:hypothetical protein
MYVRIRSWHITAPGSWSTLCGRDVATRARVFVFPADEKSCESCLRIQARRIAQEATP